MNIANEIKFLSQPINQFRTHPRNVRQGDVGAICESLEKNGQYRPIVVQTSTGHILAGNHTFLAAKSLGWKEIAATFIDCDDESALRILLVDNRANDLAMYDDRALAEVLKELQASDFGLDGSLFTGDDLDDLLYRLEGTVGMADTEKGLGDEDVAEHDTRTLLLPYEIKDYIDLTKKLSELRKELDCETNSEAVKQLINVAYEANRT